MTKLVSLADALERHVPDGCSVYITGFSHLIDFAAAHELIRRDARGLTLMRLSPDLVYDQLVAAGCAERIVFSYLGNPGVGSLPAIRRAIECGAIKWREHTHGSMIAALRAGATRAPFVPVRWLGGTDLPSVNAEARVVVSPYDGSLVTVVPPLRPDVAIVHVQRADEEGNAVVWGPVGDIREAAFAARTVIVTAEEIVPESVVRQDPDRVVVPGLAVDAVAHIPWAAHPSFAQGLYARDNRFYRSWTEVAGTEVGRARFLAEEVRGVANRAEYAERHRARLDQLARVGDSATAPVNYGDNRAMALVQE